MFRDPDSGPPWVPHADVFLSTTGEFIIKVDLAGLRREDVELQVDGRGIRFTGHRFDTDQGGSRNRFVAPGIHWGWFDLLVEVPGDYDLDAATATYENGLLRVRVPAVEETTDGHG